MLKLHPHQVTSHSRQMLCPSSMSTSHDGFNQSYSGSTVEERGRSGTMSMSECVGMWDRSRANVFHFKKTHFPFQLFVNSILKDNYIRNSVSENLRLQLTPLTP